MSRQDENEEEEAPESGDLPVRPLDAKHAQTWLSMYCSIVCGARSRSKKPGDLEDLADDADEMMEEYLERFHPEEALTAPDEEE